MYPARELNRLARHKAALREKITGHRAGCVRAATRLAEPLAWLDRMMAHWRLLSPLARLAVVPVGFLLKQSASPRPRLLGTLLHWGPAAWNILQGLRRPAPLSLSL
jgi:hypothetical protein